MRKFYTLKKVYRFLLIIPLLFIGILQARASLSKGDLAVIGMNGDVDASSTVRSFAVVALNTIAANETIYITDRGWLNGAPGSFTTNTSLDGTIQWTTSSSITAGTIIIFKLNMASSSIKTVSATKGDGSTIPSADVSISGWSNPVVTSLPWNNASGDQLLIYQGADSNPSFIFAFNNVRTTGTTNSSGGWSTDPNGVTGSGYTPKTNILYSELPSDLANTNYEIGFLTSSTSDPRFPNMKYAPGISTGSKADWLADITSVGKWSSNAAGNPFNFGLGFGTGNSTQFNVGSGVQAPTVTSVSVPANATYKIGQTLSFTINFSSNVTVTGTPQLALTIGSTAKNANYVSGSGSSALTFSYTVASGDLDTDGIAIGTLGLNGGTITDASNNNATLTLNNVASTANVLVDGVAPTVAISSTAGASGSSTSTSPVPFTVTFSESVTGFVAGDITPGNATISGFSGSGTTYTFNATPTANGAVTINIAANVAQDAAGNGNTAASQYSITYAQTITAAPVVIIPANGSLTNTTTPTYAGTAPAGATITVYVDGAALGSTTTATSGGNWAITQPAALAQGSHTVYATAQISGNAVSVNSNTNTFTVDSTRPTVAISSTAGASGSSTSTSPVPFTVTFSESVTGFVAGDITPGNATLSGFSGSGTTYTFNATPTANGTVTINIAANVAQDAAGNGNTAASQFSITYTQAVAAPTVTALSPTSGPTGGGTSVTITGTNFSGASAVTFGATAATSFTVNSATQITATAPTGTGTVDVRITTTGGTSATSASDQFTYVARPTVTALSPTSGPTGGGTSVTITGTNFSGASAVTFGATAATSFTVNSATQITATAPAGTGTVDVRITTTGGTSATSASDQFTYATPTASVTSITRLTPSPTATGTVNYRVVFSGVVTGISSSNFSLTTTGLASASVTNVSGSGSTYTVTVNTGNGDGTIRLNLANSTGLSPSISNAPYSSGEVYTVTKSFASAPILRIEAAGSASGNSDVTAFVDQLQVLTSGSVTPIQNGLQNSSFETNNVAPSNYLYQSQGVVASPWSFGTQAGVSRNNSVFGSIAANGDAVAFLQSAAGNNGAISQNLAVPTGTYQIRFYTIQRNYTSLDQRLRAFINGVYIGEIQPNNVPTYDIFTSAAFSVTAPALTATISSSAGASGSATSSSPIPFSVSFSQGVGTSFTGSDLTISGGTLTTGSFSGSGAGPYTFTITPGGTGTVSVSLAAGVATDANNTGNSASATYSFSYSQPVTASPVVNAPANGSFVNTTTPTYTGTAASNATVTIYVDNSSLATTTANASGNWSLTQPTALAQGSHTIYATAQATGNSVSPSSNTNTFTVDTNGPSVVISSTAGASGSSTGTSPIPFTVTFSEPVSGFVTGGLTVGNATISGFSGSGTTYTFNATPTANGAVTINVAANVVQDAAGNGNTAASQFSINYMQVPSLVYVNKNVTGGNGSGDSWANAMIELADALKQAKTNIAISEIWVAKGTYKPKYSPQDGANFGTDQGRNNTFLLVNNVKVYGGFAGNESTLGERDLSIAANASILSGDLDSNDGTDGTINGNNAYHIVLSSGSMGTATLNGFTLKGGNANGAGNIAVNANTIDQNKGGGLAVVQTASLSLTNLDITQNNAGSGAGVSNVNSNPVIEFARISYNKVFGGDGAGMANRSSSPKIVNTIIHHNGAAYRGGGIYNATSAPVLINVSISDNMISSNGSGAGLINDGGTSTVYNSIIWADNPVSIQGNAATVKNSLVKGGYNGTNVINQDPKFNNVTIGDYTLTVSSPAINKGDNSLFTGLDANSKDLAGNARVYQYNSNGVIDLGAYELQSVVSIPTVTSVSVPVNRTYIIADPLEFTVNFSEAIIVDSTNGLPQLALTVGSVTRYAVYVSGSGSAALKFRYTVVSGDLDSDGITVNTLSLNGGTLKNAVGTDASLTLNSVGSTSGVLVDGTPIVSQTITFATIPSKTYGDADFDPGATSDNTSIPITYTSSNTNVATIVNGKIHIIANGTSTITASQAGDATHSAASDKQQTLTVNAKAITVTAAAKSKTYGDADPALTYTFAPALVTGDSFSGSLTRTPGENVGTYAINQGTLALNSNYTLTYVGADLTISAKSITVTAAAKSKTYGDVDPALTYTFAPALATGDSFSGSLTRTPGENVGTYAINQGTLALNGNYSLTYVGADLTIGAKAMTVTAAAKSKTYGDVDPALTYTFAPALVTGDSFSGSLSRTPGENVGTYAINQGTLSLNSNYTVTYVGADLTIGAKAITVTAAAKSKTYGDVDPALTYTFAPSLVTGDSFSGSLTRAPGENVGTYAINQGTLALSSNYTVTYVGADLTIGAKTITVTAAAKSKTYGDVDPALTYTFAPALVTGDSFSGSLTRTPGEDVGTYAINQGTLALNGNYSIIYVGSNLSIGAKTITVTAAAKSKTYGDVDPALTYTFAPALATGDSFSGSLTRTPGENVGTYAINQGTLALSSNYTLTYVGADLTIGAKAITVTAAAKSKTYGDADPALTYTFAPALVTGDSFSGSLTRTTGENVGTYAINQGTLALNSNYTVTYVGADLTIGAKAIAVTAVAKSKTYGDADPALTYTFAPALVTGDSFSGSLTRAPGENVGTYAITQGTLALNSNYSLTYVGADLTIGAKSITVTAVSKNKTYGDADPALTYTFAPALATGDSFSGSLTRTPGENVGAYGINQGTLALNGNYSLTYVGADLTIGAKIITVTAAAKSKTYGDADPALTYTFTPVLVGTDTFSGSLSRTPGENVGIYAINQGTLALNSNYTLTYVGADLTIGAKTITVTAAAKSKTYGDVDPALTYTFAPALVTGDSFSGSLTRTPGENVGTYAINQGTLALNSNYTVTYVGADLTIGAKAITVTAAAKSKTYGDVDPALTYTFAPALVTGDSFSGSLTRAPGENVGTYAINQGTLALNGNYTLTYVGADLTIGAKTVTVTAAAKSKTYGDADPALTYTFAPALVGTDTFTGSLIRTPGENVGTYAINQGTLALNSNYTLTYVGADLTIGAKTITVTAAAKSKTYGDVDPALTYTFAPSLVTGDSFSGSLTRAPGENVGTYAINQGTLALNGNYSITYVGANLSIGAKTITVTAAAKSKTYGDADPALTYTFTPSLVTGDSFSGSLTRTPGENVGTYAINQGTLALNGNYSIIYVGSNLSIGAKTITVTAAAKSKTYGDADPALTYTFTPSLATGDSFSGSLTRAPGENVGTYAINQGTLALSSNYTLTYVGADLTIGAKAMTVTAAAKSKTHGDVDPALTYTFAPALVTGDSFSGSLTRIPGENVGAYAINQGTLALNGNYSLTYVGADLTIGAKAITVTAAAKSKTYGDVDPALTYTFAPALVTGDSFSGSLTRTPGENVGTYAINQGTLALNSNYTVTYVGADLTIGAKTITVTAAAKSKTYGDVDPALTYTFAPALATGDSFSGSLTRVPGENVGTYAINQGTLALNGNYSLTYVGADLTVGAKAITVTAAAKSKTYGDADPALTYTFTPSLVTGDSFSGSLTRTPGENVGTYAINQGTLALNSNYTLTYVGADLTIGAKTITVTAAAKSKTYGDADPALTYTFTPSLVTGDSFSGSLTRAPGENVGTYAINQGTLALNGNYSITYVGSNLSIGSKAITVTAAAKSKTYGDADPALTYTFTPSLATGDSFSGSLTRAPGENVGTYAINQGTLTLNGNYAISYISSNLTITKSVLTITANNAVMCQSDGFPTFGVTYSGFKTGDNESSLSTKPIVSTTANRNVAGNYVLMASGGASNNYSLVYINGTLTINAIPLVNIVSNKGTEISKGETAVLTAGGGTTYSWSTASGIISGQNTASLSVRPVQTTTYTVRVTNASGCNSSASITIKVNEDYKLVANNILTPNGDGINDTWIVQNIDLYPSNEVRIFDRNGREMYSKKSYDNSWNGTVGGNDLAEGTYYYIITYGPNKLVQKGFITIIRNR